MSAASCRAQLTKPACAVFWDSIVFAPLTAALALLLYRPGRWRMQLQWRSMRCFPCCRIKSVCDVDVDTKVVALKGAILQAVTVRAHRLAHVLTVLCRLRETLAGTCSRVGTVLPNAILRPETVLSSPASSPAYCTLPRSSRRPKVA